MTPRQALDAVSIPLGRAAMCLDCEAVNALPVYETWRERTSCTACGSRSLVSVHELLNRKPHNERKVATP